jgi:hypothetical protein
MAYVTIVEQDRPFDYGSSIDVATSPDHGLLYFGRRLDRSPGQIWSIFSAALKNI